MAPAAEKYVVYNLRETYHELGEYEFKIVLDPRHFHNVHESTFVFHDSDGRPVCHELKKWGRKMSCRFFIDEQVADGVAVARLSLQDDRGAEAMIRLTLWIIKP